MKLPLYLTERSQQASIILLFLLISLCIQEPFLWCINQENWPIASCAESLPYEENYKVLSMVAMIFIWFGNSDLSVMSTGLSAFALVCTHVLGEVIQFLIGLSFLLFMFGSSMSALRHEHLQFRDVWNTIITLFSITVLRYEGDYREINDEPILLAMLFIYIMASGILLLNLLIAQLNCSYEFVYADSVGFARLTRAWCIVDCLSTCDKKKWARFVDSLQLDKKLEFNEGDVGFAGGIQTYEASSLHPTSEDLIHRFGGSCAPTEKWPEEAKGGETLDRMERLEKLIHKAAKKMVRSCTSASAAGRQGSTSRDSGGVGGSSALTHSSEGSELADSGDHSKLV